MCIVPDSLQAKPKEDPAPAPSPSEVPLGTGLATKAKLSIMSRQERIEAATREAQGL